MHDGLKPARGIFYGLIGGIVIWLLIIGSCTAAKADSAAVWGNEPTYGLPIRVIDVMMGSLPMEDRKQWRLARDRALDNWGLPFELRRMPEVPVLDDRISVTGVCPYIVPGAITLWPVRFEPPSNTGGFVESCGGGIAQLDPRPRFMSSALIGHEVGHALGLNHSTSGIMGGGSRPSRAEVAAVQAFYLGGE